MKRSSLYLAILSLLIDLAAVLAGLMVAYTLRAKGLDLYYWPFSTYLKFAIWTLPVWLIVFASQGLYNPRVLPRGWNAFGRLLIGLLAGWGTLLIALYLWRSPAALVFPRLIIIYGMFWTGVFTFIGRIIFAGFLNALYFSGVSVTRTVVIGQANAQFTEELANNAIHGRTLVGTFSADTALEKLTEINRINPVDEVVVSEKLPEAKMMKILNWTEEVGATFVLVPSLLSVRSTNIEMGTLAGSPVMYFLRTPLEGWRRIYKRLLDVIIVVPAMIILSPLLLILFVLAQISTGRGIITQERVGQNGRVFKIHKFRSMYVDGDERFPEFKGWSTDEANDPRITKVGRILRKTNLDELAQLWDIFIGTMSFVGPRPEQPRYVEKFAKEVPDYLHRHNVKSGLTGWAQINGARGNTPVAERVKYDLYYIEHWSIWFDIRIILSTIVYVFRQIFSSK